MAVSGKNARKGASTDRAAASGAWKKRKRAGASLTPKQRQMMADAPPLGPSSGDGPSEVDRARSWSAGRTAAAAGAATKLPVLGKRGVWKQDPSRPGTGPADEGLEDGAASAAAQSAPRPKRAKAPRSFEAIRLDLASMALLLQEDPEENMKKLGEMRQLCDPAKQPDMAVVHLALVTLLTVLKDLMPGYLIRPLGQDEVECGPGGRMVSKDVKATRSFEQSFLSHYRAYLQRLQKLLFAEAKAGAEEEGRRAVVANKMVASACVADLLATASHFNHYEDIVKWAVHGALSRDQAAGVGDECCGAIVKVFKEDQHGKATCMIIRCMSDLIKERHYRVPLQALRTFLSARVRTDIAGLLPNAKIIKAPCAKKTASKRDKKEAKARLLELQRFADAEAIVSKEEQERWMSDSLRYLFRVYFGVLKKWGDEVGDDRVLGGVLEGLGHFAHLISQDQYFGDLLRSLRALTEASKPLSLATSLQCVLTVGRIQALQEKSLTLDLKFVYSFLYRQLERISTEPASSWSEGHVIGLLRDNFRVLLGPKLGLPSARLAAFAQRLVDAVAKVGGSNSEGADALLGLLHAFLSDHPLVRMALLDKEAIAQGSYLPACQDPDLCNAMSRPLLPLFQKMVSAPKTPPATKEALRRLIQLQSK